jgi:CubicO group peptidase (beta-lactamase class C family)
MPSRRTALLGAAALTLVSGAARAESLPGLGEAAAALPQLWSLTVARRGETLFAEAFRGPALQRPVNIKSVSKTIVAALTGAAIDRGLIPGVDATIGELAPALIPEAAVPQVAGIALEDLLSLRGGLQSTSRNNYGAWVNSPDWIGYVLTGPMEGIPGVDFIYSTGSTHLLGAILSEVTGQSLHRLAQDWIGAPLGIEIAAWTRDPQGRFFGGNDMMLTPAALIAFGEAFRTGGGGVVSAGWVEASWTPRTRSTFSGDLYGYGWFQRQARNHTVYYARGYGGQMLWVVPSLALTAVAISDPTLPARSDGHVGKLQRLLAELIIPALEAG